MKKPFLMALAFVTIAFSTLSFTLNDGDQSNPGEISWHAWNNRYDAQGSFGSWKFTDVSIPDGNLEKGEFTIEIDMNSISEKSERLVGHLKNADFFDVDNHPTATIAVKNIVKAKGGSYSGTATVSVLHTTADTELTFKVLQEEPFMVEGTTVIKRDQFGIGNPLDKFSHIVNDVEIAFKATIPMN